MGEGCLRHHHPHQKWSPVRSTISHPFPNWIILIIEWKMGQVVNKITFLTHRRARDLLKSQSKVVINIGKLVKFLLRQVITNLFMQYGKSTLVPLASTWGNTLWNKLQSKALQLWSAWSEHHPPRRCMCNPSCKQYIPIEKTTMSYGITLTWDCPRVHHNFHCQFQAKLD
jgi:hypothetical protein